MIIELISIGDELLKGIAVNTNAAFISCSLQQLGYSVQRHTAVSDEPRAVLTAFTEVLKRADLVICTGGLGPTLDDNTRQIAADFFHSDFHYDEAVAEDLRRRYGEELTSLKDQATLPVKAKTFTNRAGTAPGLVFSENGKILILLPGVPKEMEPMFCDEVIPYLKKHVSPGEGKRVVQLFFCLLYENLVDPHLRELRKMHPDVDAGIYPAQGTVSVSLSSANAAALDGFEKELASRFSSYLFSLTHIGLEKALHSWFTQNGKTLVVAESCTGGMIGSQLTAIPGSSDYFLGSFVTYSIAMKQKLLGVSAETIRAKGAVSEETVKEMWAGALEKSGADFAIAVSGIAGPAGGTDEKPVGTICAAIGERGHPPDIGTFHITGNRETIRLTTTNYLLGALWRKVVKGIPAFPLILP